MHKLDPQRKSNRSDPEDTVCWKEVLAAAIGGYYPPHVPVEYLVQHIKGAE